MHTIHLVSDTQNTPLIPPNLSQRNPLRLRPTTIKQHQQIRSINRIQPRPNTQHRPHHNLIPPSTPTIRTGNQLRRRIRRIRWRRRRQSRVLVSLEADSQGIADGDNLRGAGARVRAVGGVYRFAIGPCLAVVDGGDGGDGEEAGGLGLEDGDEGGAGDGGYARHAVAGGDAGAGNGLRCAPGRAAVGGEALEGVLVLGGVFAGVVDLEAVFVGLSVAEEGLPVAVDGTGV